MRVIVTSQKPTYWKCGENGHVSSSYAEKKADPNPNLAESVISVSSVMGLPTTRSGAVKPSHKNISRPSFHKMQLCDCGEGEEGLESHW